MREDLKSVLASPHDAASIAKLAEVVSELSDGLDAVKREVEALKRARPAAPQASQSPRKK